jgi:hypothetical protein
MGCLRGRDDKAIGSVVVGLTRSEAQEKYQRIQQCIPPEGAMAWISGHFGPDFSKYDPDEVVQNTPVRFFSVGGRISVPTGLTALRFGELSSCLLAP